MRVLRRAVLPAVEHAFHVGRVELGSGEPTAVCQCRKPLSVQRLWSLALLGDAVHAHDPRHVPFLFSRRLPGTGRPSQGLRAGGADLDRRRTATSTRRAAGAAEPSVAFTTVRLVRLLAGTTGPH